VVLVAGSDPTPGFGGHSSFVRAHARAAVRAGFEPHVVAIGRRDEVVRLDFGVLHRIRPLARLERVAGLHMRMHQFVWRAARLRRAVEAVVRAHPGTRIVHSIGCYGHVGLAACQALGRRGIEAVPVVSAYDTLVREGRAKLRGARALGLRARLAFAVELAWNRLVVGRWERRGLEGARLVLVNYESVRRLLAEEAGLDGRVRRIPYCSETAFLDDAPPPPAGPGLEALRPAEAPLVVAVSRHDPRKGLDVLLHALARLRRAGTPFRACLVGGGTLLGPHRELARGLGLESAVALTGFVPDPRAYLGEASLFVLPSREEGSGSLSLLEALQAGVAVVASDVDGIPEDVRDGREGLLVPPGDAGALAVAIERVLGDPGLRARLGRAGRSTFEARFSAEAFSGALREVYEEVASGRRGRP
jgi:glycosyltransferase involved in cell wall biosynthesis